MKRLTLLLCVGGIFIFLASFLGYVAADVKLAKLELNWSLSSHRLSDRIYGHTLSAANQHLFVFGGWVDQGNLSGISQDVLCTKIMPDGDTLEWKRLDRMLEEPVYAHATVIANDRVYIIGGTVAKRMQTSKVYFANIPDNCSIKDIPWQETLDPLPKTLERHAAVYYDGAIYVVGGRNEQDGTQNAVYSAIIHSDGQIDEWREDLPEFEYFDVQNHSLIAHNNRLYLIGGRSGSGSEVRGVYFADILTRGVTSKWQPLPAGQFLPNTLYSHKAVNVDGRIYVIGGFRSGSVNEVLSAEVLKNGYLTSWTHEKNELPSRTHWHSSVIAENGVMYTVGGIRTTKVGNKWTHEYLDTVFYTGSPLTLTKTNDPPGSVHEGDLINYTISYANTSLITQTISITDVLPFDLTYITNSATPTATQNGSLLTWNLGDVSPGTSGQVSFQAKVALAPVLDQPFATDSLLATSDAPAYVLPVPIACDTTRFWANGVTRQPPQPNPHTIKVQIPPGAEPSTMWLLMKKTENISPEIEGVPATLEKTVENEFGASLWSAPVTSATIAAGEVTVVTRNPRNLNAIFLFEADDPPFEQTILDDFYNTTKTFSYTLNVPSVATQTIDIILPFMDITYLTDDSPPQPDTRKTEITVQFDGQSHTVVANNPNLGNGLLMAQFPFEIGPLTSEVMTKTVSVTVNTEDSVYTLGPRICRPVYIENTTWLCSEQAGCISDSARNIPDNIVVLLPPPSPGGPTDLFLPIILKSS